MRGRVASVPRFSTAAAPSVFSTRSLLIVLLLLLALLFFNALVRDFANVTLEVLPDVDSDDAEPISLWPGYAHEAPRGKTCQQWLTQADEQPGSIRDWQQQPVVIAAGEERTLQRCAVPCVLVREPGVHFQDDDWTEIQVM